EDRSTLFKQTHLHCSPSDIHSKTIFHFLTLLIFIFLPLSGPFSKIFLNPLIKFLRRIVSHLFLPVIYSRRLYNDRKVSSWTDRNPVAHNFISKELCIFLFQSQTVVFFISAPVLQRNDKIDILCIPDTLYTEHGSDINDADSAQFDKMLCDI